MSRANPGAIEQHVETPGHAEWGRFANEFGTAHKAFFITADSMTFDFGRIAPIEFAFIDGGHDLEHVLNDSRKVYDVLSPGGWLVWHDFNSPVAWVKVREAIEVIGFAEPVVHVEGTEGPYFRKHGGDGPPPWTVADMSHTSSHTAFALSRRERVPAGRVRRETGDGEPPSPAAAMGEGRVKPRLSASRVAGSSAWRAWGFPLTSFVTTRPPRANL